MLWRMLWGVEPFWNESWCRGAGAVAVLSKDIADSEPRQRFLSMVEKQRLCDCTSVPRSASRSRSSWAVSRPQWA